ncbi:MAG: aminopeptidase P family protein [Eubacterium sp.]|nr:aminopeptidase P family protein [Eubacterium sp.]
MKENIKVRIEKLRKKMKEEGVTTYLIVSDDFHGSEYVCDYFKCREYLSGFTGSAGTMVVTEKEAKLWTDGRYFLQANEQLKGSGITLMKMGEKGVLTVQEYLENVLQNGESLGYDGRTIGVNYANSIKAALREKEIEYKEDIDLVGAIWRKRPKIPNEPIWLLKKKYAGKSRKQKLKLLRDELRRIGADATLIVSLDDIAWLYNLRGDDMKYSPVALSYTIVYQEKAVLYRDEESIRKQIVKEFEKDKIEIAPYSQVYEDIEKLQGITLLIDEKTVNVSLRSKIPADVHVINQMNPTTLAKAKKNETEMKNERHAHLLDGVAVTKLIYWLKKRYRAGKIDKVTELEVCKKLESLRKLGEGYLQQSFAPIVATGAHGAIVHYEPTKATNVPLQENTFVLIDTGGQYLYGTTDITRTVALGELTREQKEHYTAVVRGHLKLAAAIFPYGCTGANLDCLARGPLWELGGDYKHGTGHGVGYLLNVHEGPTGIRLRESDGSAGAVLEEGMLVSNEPGFYQEGQYGIRVENLMLCQKRNKTEYGQFMRFEMLTMVPFEREAILPEMMSDKEILLLNWYHAVVYEKLERYMNAPEKKWLKSQTQSIEKKIINNYDNDIR